MRLLERICLLLILIPGTTIPAWAYVDTGTNALIASRSELDLQTAINLASDGTTVWVTNGQTTITTGLSISGRAIYLRGMGVGGYIGHSKTSLSIATGSKTFITHTNNLAFTNNQTIRALYSGNGTNYMEGTVTSYTGNTLVLNVTNTSGSGTKAAWTLLDPTAVSELIFSSGSTPALTITPDTSASVQVSDIKFSVGTGTGNMIKWNSGGMPVQFHHCWLVNGSTMSGNYTMSIAANQGVLYKCSFDSGMGGDGAGFANNYAGLQFKDVNDTASWTTRSYLGTNDLGQTNNFYVEDNYFAGMYLQAGDVAGHARVVIRKNVFDNSALTSHGTDTETLGARSFQVNSNKFIFDSMGTETYNLSYWFFIRGASGAIIGNDMDDINSSQWGNKNEIFMELESLRRDDGPYPCTITYPIPHGIGQDWAGGIAITNPLVIVGNGNGASTKGDFSCSDPNACANCASQPTTAQFVLDGRDVTNAIPAGLVATVYPVAWRSDQSQSVAPPNYHVQNLVIRGNATVASNLFVNP